MQLLRMGVLAVIITSFIGISPVFADPITMKVFASSAPNVFGSPSWSDYLLNALDGIESGGLATGIAGTASYYSSGTIFDPGDMVVSSFNSWKGEVPGDFAGEFGNRLHFGLSIYGSTLFSLDQLNFGITSSDPSNALGFSGDFIGSSYSATRVGINWGGDGLPGGGDDVMITSGSGDQEVNELYYVGVGNAFWPDTPGEIASTVDYINSNGGSGGPFEVVGEYWLTDEDGKIVSRASTTATIRASEPLSFSMIGLGLLGIGILKTRKRSIPQA